MDSDAESEVERAESKETEESGIVSESVSASSVILMFGGTGKFKKSHGAPSKDGEGKRKFYLVINATSSKVLNMKYKHLTL